MTTYRLNGMRLKLVAPDLDGDGVTGGIERVTTPGFGGASDMQPITQPAETREAMRELNDDSVDGGTRMSNIDMKTRLSYIDMTYVLGFDALVALRVIPPKCLALTRQKKRLCVSLNGKGREEIVTIANGERNRMEKENGGMLKSFFGMGKKNEM